MAFSQRREKTSVLIVGGGPVGLALAIELGQRGVSCVVLERNERVGLAPRAKTTHVRTREHLRRWGIAKDLAAASPLGVDYPSTVMFVTQLAGFELTRFDNVFQGAPVRNELYSEHAQWVPQYVLERVLRAEAERLPEVKLKSGCEFLTASQSDHSVISKYRSADRPPEIEIESAYLVGADGARSAVRTLIGARMQGTYGLSRNYNFVFRAPGLASAHRHGPAIMYWQVNPDFPSLIGPMDVPDTWFFMPTRLADGMKLDASSAAAAISRATGIAGHYEVLSSDEWVASELIADRYSAGRIFLAGDACHLHPPFGGYGMNMGIADAVDLGWKMSAVLQGWGGSALLDSYELERRPTHELVIAEAVANHAALADSFWQPGLDAATDEGARLRAQVGDRIKGAKAREFHNLGCVLGYCYEHSPVIIPDGSVAPDFDAVRYEPCATPGSVAPHAWLDNETSLYDSFGKGMTLLTGAGAEPHVVRRIASDAQEIGLPLKVVALPNGPVQSIYAQPYILVRPDQHVAWRAAGYPGISVLRIVSGRDVNGSPRAANASEGAQRSVKEA